MRRNLFLASALVMGLMSSCSNDVENVTAPSEKLQPIELSLGSPSVVINPSTKGVGTVGDLTKGENNKWNGEDLYVIMMCKYDKGNEVWNVSTWPWIEDMSSPIAVNLKNFDNLKVQAPTGTDQGSIVINDGQARYYPPTDTRHAFFAYHIDDAAANESYESQPEPKLVDDDEARTRSVYFKIDGSQDLMQGEAVPSKPDTENIAFSAKSARAQIIPQLQMKHLLSRFTFEVKGGDATAETLQVNKITVKSKYKGTMCVAYFNNPGELITFEDEKIAMELKERAGANQEMTELQPLSLTQSAFQRIGESLLVAPGESVYEIEVVTTQSLTGGKTNTFVHTSTIELNKATESTGVALAGSSYNVQITLFGLSGIEVHAHLTGWNEGGNIEVKPGDEI